MNITSVDQALDLVKTMYITIYGCIDLKASNNSNYSILCSCLDYETITDYASVVKWNSVLFNTNNFNAFKKYLTEQIAATTVKDYEVVIDKFCSRYEWHAAGIHDINESSNCSVIVYREDTIQKKRQWTETGPLYRYYLFLLFKNELIDCSLYFFNDVDTAEKAAAASAKAYDKFLKCVYMNINPSCNKVIKKKVILEAMLIKPELFGSDITAYIESIENSEQTSIKRYSTFLIGDPHVLSFGKNQSVTCNLVNETCLNTT